MLLSLLALPLHAADIQVLDLFGRDATQAGITLTDWEGEIGNPAIRLELKMPDDANYPCDVHLHGSSSRIYFDRADANDRSGIGRRVRLDAKPEEPLYVWVSIFPDRDGEPEKHNIMLQRFAGGRELERFILPVEVRDEDQPSRETTFRIHLDYSEDRTGFFASEDARRVIRQVADDWAYFIDGSGFTTVKAGKETGIVWNPDGFKSTRPVTVNEDYKGFYLYLTGIQHDEMRAGGAPSPNGGWQFLLDLQLPLRRSGAVEFETRGNWNTLGWWFSKGNEDWWVSGSLRGEPADFYSIALHETGHALGFESRYPFIEKARQTWRFDSPLIREYVGEDLAYDQSDHLPGSMDPASRLGGFGAEYQGMMKNRRWLITKLHLVALKSIGYPIRDVSCFKDLSLSTTETWNIRNGEATQYTPTASGGIRSYRWSAAGLPRGLTINSVTGEISGTPGAPGTSTATIKVEDQSPKQQSREAKMEIVVR